MKEDIILKIKEKESLEVLKTISIIYLVFLFFLALIFKYQETIIQSLLIAVFAFIIDAINSGEMIVTEKGITCKTIGFLKYSNIDKVEKKGKVMYLYSKENKRHKIFFAQSEDLKTIENAYRFIDSKVKIIEEDNREHQEYVENFLQKIKQTS